jgi:hypothetical protein
MRSTTHSVGVIVVFIMLCVAMVFIGMSVSPF